MEVVTYKTAFKKFILIFINNCTDIYLDPVCTNNTFQIFENNYHFTIASMIYL